MKYVTETGKCPGENCDVEIQPDCKMIEFFNAKLDRMFVDYSKVRIPMLINISFLIIISVVKVYILLLVFYMYM